MADHGPYFPHVQILSLIDGQDQRILAAKAAREAIRAKVKAGKVNIARLARRLEKTESAISQAESEVRSQERALAEVERRIERTGSMENVTTQKEYEAAQVALESLKVQKGETEDIIITKMMELDELRPLAQETRKALETAEPAYASMRARAKVEFDAQGAELASAGHQRQEYLDELGQAGLGVLELYESIMRRHGDRAVTVAVDESCNFCHITVSPQHVLEVRLGKALHDCDHCGRIVMPPAPSA